MAVEGEPAASRGNAAYAEMLARELPLVSQAVRFVASRNGLTEDEREDLQSMVHEKLIENDYAVLRKFEGRSTLKTYLVTVVHRLFLDHRSSEQGKWRPSATAQRGGPDAIELERMMLRDGLSFEEAFAHLAQPRSDGSLLRSLASAFPPRTPRRFIAERHLAMIPARDGLSDQGFQEAQYCRQGSRLANALERALASIPGQDRLLLKLRFLDEFQIVEISEILRLPPRMLYKRLSAVLLTLRRMLEEAGLEAQEVIELIGRPEVEIRSAFLSESVSTIRYRDDPTALDPPDPLDPKHVTEALR